MTSTTSSAMGRRSIVLGTVLMAMLGTGAATNPSVASAGAGGTGDPPIACRTSKHPVWIANALLDDRYRFGSFPEVRLPHDLTWREDPLGQNNWRVRLHELRWVDALTLAWSETGERRYRARAKAVINDWIEDNPRSAPATHWAWYDQTTGLRASVLTCALRIFGGWPRLRSSLQLHGALLADPSFYVGAGNHALDQAMGLLDTGAVLGRDDWMRLARDRMARLVVASVNARGVTNEQAVGYQAYNLSRYRKAEARLRAHGVTVPSGFARVDLMSRFLAHATLPNGEYEMVGDTEAHKVRPEPGTEAQFAATEGQLGTRPATTVFRDPDRGWLFARTGWGTERPFRDEIAMSLRWGPGPIFHGHADAGSVTLYGYGSRLLLDPGKFTYNPTAMRAWFRGRSAHNVVIVDGERAGSDAALEVGTAVSGTSIEVDLAGRAGSGIRHERTVTFSRGLGFLVVEDRLRSNEQERFRQRWHLAEDARPEPVRGGFVTTGPAGRVKIVELTGASKAITGGWLSYTFGRRLRAPIAELRKVGATARFVTILAPFPAGAEVSITHRSVTENGYAFTISVDGRQERVESVGGVTTVTRLLPIAPEQEAGQPTEATSAVRLPHWERSSRNSPLR